MAFIRKFLDLSTGHLTADTRAALDSGNNNNRFGIPCAVTDYGFFVYADEEPNDEVLPEELVKAMRHARANGCEYILFDCDAEIDAELDYFNED